MSPERPEADALEEDLRTFAPAPMSHELRRRIERSLAARSQIARRWAATALAAAAFAAAVMWAWPRPPAPQAIPNGPVAIAPERVEASPLTLGAAGRALARSDRAFEALLDADARRTGQPAPGPMLRADARSLDLLLH